jgi:hypothetical protein
MDGSWGLVKEAPLPLPLYIRDQSGASQIAKLADTANMKLCYY